MKRLSIGLLTAAALIAFCSAAGAQNIVAPCTTVSSTNLNCVRVSPAAPLPVTNASGGTVDTNWAETLGSAVATGVGASGANTPKVGIASDSTLTSVGTLSTVTNPVGVKGSDGSAIASVSNPFPTSPTPLATSTAGVAPVFSSTVETGHVIKASAGNLYSLSATANSTLSASAWAIMVFNSTTVPAAGAVTPAWCILLPAGATGYTGAFLTPMYLSTGISIAVSVGQTCFTKTDSANAFISANAK